MKKILHFTKNMFLVVGILMLTNNTTFGQEEVIVEPEEGLNAITTAVTDNPGATIILRKGGQYVFDSACHITVPTIIRGEDYTLDDPDGPAVLSMLVDPSENGTSKYLFLAASDLTLENVGIIGYSPDNVQYGGAVLIDKDGTLDIQAINCVVQGSHYFMKTQSHNGGIYTYHDNIFFNMCTQRPDNLGGFTGPQYKGDSIVFKAWNNTYFTGGRAHGSTSKGVMGVQEMDHNTYVNTWGEDYYKNYGYQFTVTNNIYYNTHIRGYVGERYKADTLYYGGDHVSYDDFGDTLNGTIMSFPHVLDSVTEAGKDRIFDVTNNLQFDEQRVMDWNDAHGVTEFPFITPSNYGFITKYGWNVTNNWSPDDGTQYDPEFVFDIPDEAFTQIMLQSEQRRFAEADRSPEYPFPIYWHPNGEEKKDFIWPLPFDFKPTAAALLTAGSDGYPLGDLNWFGQEMVEAWENGWANPVIERRGEQAELSLVNYPNPFSSNTQIRYNLSDNSHVIMKIYDVTGAEVANLVNENQIAGQHEVMFDGANLSGGVYFCRIMAGNTFQVHKMTLIK
ncbi:MAG: T9SS type A sorting domain-containing protein [Bacteroidota bacterium]